MDYTAKQVRYFQINRACKQVYCRRPGVTKPISLHIDKSLDLSKPLDVLL